MKKLFFVAFAAVAMMLASCGGKTSENVTGDMKKDAAKMVEIMNKSGEVNNEDSKIMEEIAAYYEAEGKSEEFQKEFQDQFTAETMRLLRTWLSSAHCWQHAGTMMSIRGTI